MRRVEVFAYSQNAGITGGRRWCPWMKLRFGGDFWWLLICKATSLAGRN